MGIQCVCPNCGKSYNVPEDKVGHKGRCRSCQNVFVLAASAEAVPGIMIQPPPVEFSPTPAPPFVPVPAVLTALTEACQADAKRVWFLRKVPLWVAFIVVAVCSSSLGSVMNALPRGNISDISPLWIILQTVIFGVIPMTGWFGLVVALPLFLVERFWPKGYALISAVCITVFALPTIAVASWCLLKILLV